MQECPALIAPLERHENITENLDRKNKNDRNTSLKPLRTAGIAPHIQILCSASNNLLYSSIFWLDQERQLAAFGPNNISIWMSWTVAQASFVSSADLHRPR